MTNSEFIQVSVLAVIQGIAEFLPISSSGHLVVLGKLFQRISGEEAGIQHENIVLNLTLHLGTLAAILLVYRKDIWGIWRKPRLCLAIVLATIPAAVLGILLEKYVKATFEMPIVVACGWLVTAGLLWFSQRPTEGKRSIDDLSMVDALVIGCFQAVSALFRGVSRSGSTITGGLVSGYDRQSAATFSFLIAIPAIAGAATLKFGVPLIKAIVHHEPLSATLDDMMGGYSPWSLMWGGLLSFCVGWASLRWLIGVIVRKGLRVFVAYVLLASLLTFAWQGYEYFHG